MEFKKDAETKITCVAVNELEPLKKLYEEISTAAREKFNRTVNLRGITVQGAGEVVNITPSDFFSTERNLSDQNLLEHVKTYLQADDIGEVYRIVNKCFEVAKDFMENFLYISLPAQIKNETDLNNQSSLLKFLRRTQALKTGANIGFSPYYCALTKIMKDVWELETKAYKGLEAETEYLCDKMFRPDASGFSRFHKIKTVDDKWKQVGMLDYDNQYLQALMGFRGKSRQRALCKMLSKPEFDAESAIKDGIGMRFEIDDPNSAAKLVNFLIRYLNENESTGYIIMRNRDLLNTEQLDLIGQSAEDVKILMIDTPNHYSHNDYAALYLSGNLRVPKHGQIGAILTERNFEIMVSLKDNKNEHGMARHEIYEAVQKLSVVTRLFGPFSDQVLLRIVDEAHQRSGLSSDKIQAYITQKHLVEVEVGNKSRRHYISKNHLERWQNANLIEDRIKEKQKKP